MTIERSVSAPTWRDPSAAPAERVSDLLAQMSIAEKVAQLQGVWVGAGCRRATSHRTRRVRGGPGQLGRTDPARHRPAHPASTAPRRSTPAEGARAVARSQRQIMAAGRHGIPAIVHEECLTGLAAWQAPVYPSPMCWGATFDPALVERMGAQIGATMRRLGVHQGLAPVLDVVRDLRWGRAEETIGEDPYLVGTVGSAYVRGLESSGRGGHAEALRRLLGLARRAEPRAGLDRAPRAGRRAAAAVRDGAAGRGALGDELLHRPGRACRRPQTPAC